ncbi:sugar ABC transporter permease [Dictyobacter alpinus]|uniref:Sugar ABC transporter permease n=1 Tax=Dictyobacter alpinus TaxID=2014873 RepID=A0A402B1E7_9CHLR|nr:carbohydrate ABC transporter permease [Dictyobacter alpinus]GCE25159.1 sugar ABC transporter permease [Dictyobacter alpinus]
MAQLARIHEYQQKPEQGTRARKSIRTLIEQGMVFTLLVFFTLLFVSPLIWLLITALKPLADMAAFPIRWLPSQVQWQNFFYAVTYIDFWHYALNSLTLAVIQSSLITITSAMVGFGFARLRGFGKQKLLMVMLATTMLPGMVTIIPTYIIFSKLGMVDTYWPWVVWGLASSPFFSFMFRQFFSSIPGELEEAAIMDGCSYWRIFWQLFLPLSRPVLAIVIIFAFTGVWDDFLGPILFLNADNTTLAVAISNGYLDPQGHRADNVLAAGSLLYALPVLIIFLLTQRFLINNSASSGLKG